MDAGKRRPSHSLLGQPALALLPETGSNCFRFHEYVN